MNVRTLFAMVLISVLGACSMDPVHVEHDFGQSVRQMVAGQIIDPETASNPSPMAPDRLDGVGAEESLKGYRRDANRADGEQREIRLSID